MLRFAFAAIALLALAACDPAPSTDDATGLANPAATFCIEKGGQYQIVDGADGQTGTCTLADGSTQDAWEYFRGENMG